MPPAVFWSWQLAGSTTLVKSRDESSTPVFRSTYSWKPNDSFIAALATCLGLGLGLGLGIGIGLGIGLGLLLHGYSFMAALATCP